MLALNSVRNFRMSACAISRSGVIGLVCLGVLLGPIQVSAAAQANSEADLVDILPHQSGLYFWTSDAKSVGAAVLDFLSVSVADDDLPDFLLGLERIASVDRRFAHLAEQFSTLRRAIQLLEEGVLDSQLMWIYAPREDGTFGHSIIAHSTAPKEEIDTLLAGLDAVAFLLTQLQDHTDLDSKARLGFSAYESDWIVWSDDQAMVDELLRQLEARGESATSIGSNRVFKTVFANIVAQDRSPLISVYATSDMIPELLDWSRFSREIIDVDSWAKIARAAFLHELRGFGGHLLIGQHDILDATGGSFAFDMFVVLTQPRHGILSAVERKDGDFFDVPVIDKPMAQFAQIEFDGFKLAGGIRETQERLMDEYPGEFGDIRVSFLSPDRHSTQHIEHPNQALLESAVGALSIEYYSDSYYGNSVPKYLETWNALELSNRNSTVQHVSDSLNQDQEGMWIRTDEDDVSLWSVSQDEQDRIRERVEETIAYWERSMAEELANARRGNETRDEIRQRHDSMREMIPTYRSESTRFLVESYICVDNWLFLQSIREYNFDAIRDWERMVARMQLEDIKQTLDVVASEFQISPCGVFVRWPDRIRELLQANGEQSSRGEELEDGVEATVENAVTTLEMSYRTAQEKVYGRIDKVVIALGDDSRGFRLVGLMTNSRSDDDD